jgi:uncharacterized protein YprB with RNaseH-like and TPR domain/predicted RNA-binding Zn-ribbon protein involved in translation (DUF1610 family)
VSKYKPKGKILSFDLETADLSANRGHIICAAAKWVGEKMVYTWRIDEGDGYRDTPQSFYNDKHIVEGLKPLLEEADAVLAYYGSGFDVPYLNTRAIINKVAPPIPYTLIDPWKTARSQLKLARNDMGSVASVFGARPKTHLPWDDWQRARYGDSAAISKLLKYNINDIKVLEEIYLEMRPVIQHHPYIGAAVSGTAKLRCPACGSTKSKDHDCRRTKTFEVFRRRCNHCGAAYESHRRKIA